MNRFHWALAVLGVTGVLALPASAATGDATAPATITVTGTGTVSSAPQVTVWSFGATTRADTASGAFAAASSTMRKLIAAIKAEGIAADDLQTQQVSLMVQQNDDGTKTIGYAASSSVQVTVRALDTAGAVVDAAVAAGATDVSGPSFDLTGRDELYRRALGAAVDDATAKARVLAASAGVTLGRIATLTEGSSAMPVIRADASPQSSGGVPIEPGESEVTASVTATFAVT
jgi:uncharacterized protein